MIWLLVFAVALAAVGAFLLSKSMVVRAVTIGGVAVAAGLYFQMGRPGMGDQPYAQRIAEIEKRSGSDATVESLKLEEVLALLESRSQKNPNDAQLHFRMSLLNDILRQPAKGRADYVAGLKHDPAYAKRLDELLKLSSDTTALAKLPPQDLLMILEERAWQEPGDPQARVMMGRVAESVGEIGQAQLYFQAALARDPNSPQALSSMGRLIFRATGKFDEDVATLYRRAYAGDPNDPAIAIMAALDIWLRGDKPGAEAIWAATLAKLPPDDGLRTMYSVIRRQFAPTDAATSPPAPAPEKPPAKPPQKPK